jgi:hypothetical protein
MIGVRAQHIIELFDGKRVVALIVLGDSIGEADWHLLGCVLGFGLSG